MKINDWYTDLRNVEKILAKKANISQELMEMIFALISKWNLIDRKNYKIAIEIVAKSNNPNVHYFICDESPEKNLKELTCGLCIKKQVQFLEYRNDIKELLKAAGIFLFVSK